MPGRGHEPPPAPPLPHERDRTVIGPMARSAADLTHLLRLLAESDPLALGTIYRLALPASRHERLADFRVLIVDSHPMIPTSVEIREHIDRFAGALIKSGAKLRARPRCCRIRPRPQGSICAC